MSHNTHSTVGQNAGRVLYALSGNDCKMQIAKCKLQIRGDASQSPVTSHQSPRLGISLTEVLIAMGILTVGLLGVAAIFPVAGFYMQKGEVADRGSAIAQAAFNEVVSRGMLDPERWLMWEDGQVKPAPVGNQLQPGNTSSFTRNFAEKMRQQSAQLSANGNNPTSKQWNVATEFGAAYVIDPLGVASVSWSVPKNYGSKFPSTVFRLDSTANDYVSSNWWRPWYISAPSPATENFLAWPIRRVTVAQAPVTPLSMQLSDRLFTSVDDLAIDVPTAADKPSQQMFQLANLDGGSRADDSLARQSRGDYSWIVTVVPSSSDARDALASDPSAYNYEVSVAVFYKRILGRTTPTTAIDVDQNITLMKQNERMVRAKVVSTGLSGGELLLEPVEPTTGAPSDVAPAESPFAGLKAGNWYLLAGPHPNSTSVRPLFVARWYRVLSIEGKDTKLDASGNPTTNLSEPERRLVSLRGPQWPWQPQANATDLSNNLCLSVVANVVAVHSKTIQLEGRSSWSVQ